MHGLLELLKLAEGDGTVSFKAPSSAHSEFATNVERAIRPSNLLNLTEQVQSHNKRWFITGINDDFRGE